MRVVAQTRQRAYTIACIRSSSAEQQIWFSMIRLRREILLRGGSARLRRTPQGVCIDIDCRVLGLTDRTDRTGRHVFPRWVSTNRPSREDGDDDAKNGRTAVSSEVVSSAMDKRAFSAILSQMKSPPNMLTMSRIIATPYLSYILLSHYSERSTEVSAVSSSVDGYISSPTLALSLFLMMGFTDWLDGYVARRWPSTATVLGTYLDPIADKLFIGVTGATLWYTSVLPGPLVLLWVGRDIAMVGSVYWYVAQNKDAENGNAMTSAVMDPLRTPFQLQASMLSKVNTTLQIGLIALGIASQVPSVVLPPELMPSLVWITAGTTVGSTIGYLDGSALKKSGNRQERS